MTLMTITCDNYENFLTIIAGLVERGLGFTANGDNFVITLTGAH